MYPIRALKRSKAGLAALLEPISGDSPCGEPLRYEGTYDRIQAARSEDDPVLARGVWKTPLKRADWGEVERLSVEALEKRTKDLQIAVWLTEAWLHLDGFAGMAYGLRLLAALCLRYWNGLHPQGDGPDAMEYRTAPIVILNEKLSVLVKLLPLTGPASDDVKAYCWADWESGTTRHGPSGPAGGGPTQAQFRQSAMLTPPDFFLALLEDVEASMDACSELETVLEKQCGKDAPSLRHLWSVMDSIRELFSSIVSQRGPEEGQGQPAEEAERHADSLETDAPAEPAWLAGSIRNRAEAYRRLAEAADYLARTEPHSPTPYLVRRAIGWGSMRFEDVLAELVRNNNELSEIFRLLQISKAAEK